MTDIEQKALALVNEVRSESGYAPIGHLYRTNPESEALCRAIEQHEAFRQEVSDAVEVVVEVFKHEVEFPALERFIIPKPKPDPLVAALEGVTFDHYPLNDAKTIRAVLDAAGFEIREKNDD